MGQDTIVVKVFFKFLLKLSVCVCMYIYNLLIDLSVDLFILHFNETNQPVSGDLEAFIHVWQSFGFSGRASTNDFAFGYNAEFKDDFNVA